jgi:hypothetical protein
MILGREVDPSPADQVMQAKWTIQGAKLPEIRHATQDAGGRGFGTPQARNHTRPKGGGFGVTRRIGDQQHAGSLKVPLKGAHRGIN